MATETYLRDDIYFCECCGYFFDIQTNKLVDVPLETIPAEVAIEVMTFRQGVKNRPHTRKKRKGFGDL
jgi:hypothetical protein